jgi:predicted metal-dependent TIM-barrel fold hydrolase
VATLFTLQPGGIATGAGPDGQYVAQLKEIQPADPATDVNGVGQMSAQLNQEISAEMLKQFDLALRERFPVEIHATALDQLTGGGAAQ